MDQSMSSISPDLERFARLALEEGVKLAKEGINVQPFLMVEEDDDVIVTTHAGEDPDEIMESVRSEIRKHRDTSSMYAFAYDGYVSANKSQLDAVIVEFATRGDILAHAIGLPYCGEGESFETDEEATYLGECPSLYILTQGPTS